VVMLTTHGGVVGGEASGEVVGCCRGRGRGSRREEKQ